MRSTLHVFFYVRRGVPHQPTIVIPAGDSGPVVRLEPPAGVGKTFRHRRQDTVHDWSTPSGPGSSGRAACVADDPLTATRTELLLRRSGTAFALQGRDLLFDKRMALVRELRRLDVDVSIEPAAAAVQGREARARLYAAVAEDGLEELKRLPAEHVARHHCATAPVDDPDRDDPRTT